MHTTSQHIVLWAPRLLGVATCLFIGAFALDAFTGAPSFASGLADFAIHLVPALALLAVVALAWRRAWIGGVVFLALAILYAITMAKGRLDWMVAISGPLAVVGLLFLWSWRLTPRRSDIVRT